MSTPSDAASDSSEHTVIDMDARYQTMSAHFERWAAQNDPEEVLEISYYNFDTLPPLPETVQNLKIHKCLIQSLPHLPSSLKEVVFYKTTIRTKTEYSDGIRRLVFDESFVPAANFPETLEDLIYIECNLVDLPLLPPSLQHFRVLDCIVPPPLPALPPNLRDFIWMYTEIDGEFPMIPDSVQNLDVEGHKTRQAVARYLARYAAGHRG